MINQSNFNPSTFFSAAVGDGFKSKVVKQLTRLGLLQNRFVRWCFNIKLDQVTTNVSNYAQAHLTEQEAVKASFQTLFTQQWKVKSANNYLDQFNQAIQSSPRDSEIIIPTETETPGTDTNSIPKDEEPTDLKEETPSSETLLNSDADTHSIPQDEEPTELKEETSSETPLPFPHDLPIPLTEDEKTLLKLIFPDRVEKQKAQLAVDLLKPVDQTTESPNASLSIKAMVKELLEIKTTKPNDLQNQIKLYCLRLKTLSGFKHLVAQLAEKEIAVENLWLPESATEEWLTYLPSTLKHLTLNSENIHGANFKSLPKTLESLALFVMEIDWSTLKSLDQLKHMRIWCCTNIEKQEIANEDLGNIPNSLETLELKFFNSITSLDFLPLNPRLDLASCNKINYNIHNKYYDAHLLFRLQKDAGKV